MKKKTIITSELFAVLMVSAILSLVRGDWMFLCFGIACCNFMNGRIVKVSHPRKLNISTDPVYPLACGDGYSREKCDFLRPGNRCQTGCEYFREKDAPIPKTLSSGVFLGHKDREGCDRGSVLRCQECLDKFGAKLID